MKKSFLSLLFVIIAAPRFVLADNYVAATSYVQGAYNALAGSKQDKLQNNAGTPADINASVLTSVRAASNASDTNLVTEKAVAGAIETAVTVSQTGDTYGSITAVTNANGGIQVTRGATQVQIKSNNAVTGAAAMWIE